MIKNKKIVITGGAGAVGSNLCHELIKYNNKILIIDNFISSRVSNIPKNPLVSYIDISILDPNCFNAIINFNPSYMFHLAAFFANQNSVDNPEIDLDINIKGTIKLLQIAEKLSIDKFIYTSSSCVYGKQNGELVESLRIGELDTPYAISKYAAEHYCKFWNSYYNVPTIILRLFNSFGPWEHPGIYRNVIPNFFELALDKKPLTITGSGEETRDFNYVENTISGLINAAESDKKNAEIYNIAAGAEIRIIDMAKKINDITSNNSGINFLPKRKWDNIQFRKSNIELAKKQIKYRPQIDFNKGLEKTYEWFKSKDSLNE